MSLSTIYGRPWPLCSDNQHLFEQQLLSRRLLFKVQFKEKIQIKNTKLFKPGLPKQSLFVSQVSSLASVFPALRNFKIYLSCFFSFSNLIFDSNLIIVRLSSKLWGIHWCCRQFCEIQIPEIVAKTFWKLFKRLAKKMFQTLYHNGPDIWGDLV